MSQIRRGDGPSREASPSELKAIAHPMRLRILRLCTNQSQTNKQIADRLKVDPATSLHHVRVLVRNGFLVADPPRTGERGSLERPYRSTGKSWLLALPGPDERTAGVQASIDALRDEIGESGADSVLAGTRIGLVLSDATASELARELEALIDRYARRDPDADGQAYGLFAVLHRGP